MSITTAKILTRYLNYKTLLIRKIQRTNDLQEYIFTDDWIQNKDQIKDYKFKLIKWVRVGEQYLTAKRKSTQAINYIIDDPLTTTRLRKIMLELKRDIYSDEQNQDLLRKVNNSLISKDNIIAKDSGNIMDSKGSIFTEPELKHKTNNTIEHHIVHEHEALQNLSTKNDYTHQDLIVNMFSPSAGG